MIRNLIFDMGRVLVEFDPERNLDRKEVYDPRDRELLLKEIFHHHQWHEMDMGLLDEAQMYEDVCTRIPEHLHEKAYELIFDWNDPIVPVEGMEELLKECTEKGLKLYLLSNASVAQPIYWLRIPGHQYFEGTVVSALEKCVKPNRRLYEILLNRYELDPRECLFIDDVKANVEAGEALGIKGYLFDGNTAALREFLMRNSIL